MCLKESGRTLLDVLTFESVCVSYLLPAKFNKVDEGSEIFNLIWQQVSCGVRGGQDVCCIIWSLTEKEKSVKDHELMHWKKVMSKLTLLKADIQQFCSSNICVL